MSTKIEEVINNISERREAALAISGKIRHIIESSKSRSKQLSNELNDLLSKEVKAIGNNYIDSQRKQLHKNQWVIAIALALIAYSLFRLVSAKYLNVFSISIGLFLAISFRISYTLYNKNSSGYGEVNWYTWLIGIAAGGYYALHLANFIAYDPTLIVEPIIFIYLPAIALTVSSSFAGEAQIRIAHIQGFVNEVDYNSFEPDVPIYISQKVASLQSAINSALKKEPMQYDGAAEIFDFVNHIYKSLEDKNNELVEAIETSRKILIDTEEMYSAYPELTQTDPSSDKKPEDINFPLPMVRIGNSILRIHEEDKLHVPITLDFFNNSNLLFECDGNDKDIVKNVVDQVISRMLLSVKPGKLKLICIDPVGLGANFKHFTALDKKIYGGKVWVEDDHIMKQMTKLSNHIEKIIQDYLQDKYTDILDYNSKAKEVEEPYNLLVIYNFPEGLNDQTVKKLRSVMENGPKRGVCTILVHEAGAKFPYGTSYHEFTAHHANRSINLKSYQNELIPNELYSDFQPIALENISKLIQQFSAKFDTVKDETTKVPFKDHLAKTASWWQADCSEKFEIKIGKAGANEEQRFYFDNKDKPNALMVGRPGSGKSNLLHIIILSAITKYKPSELAVFLIDFKGGVEFIPYAERPTKHIKTIAVASDREFGISILKGLEKELLTREDLFREKQVTNLHQFRTNYPDVHLPRILFIADEFQEFFTYRDKLSEDAQIIFERIIRKGRAFGINILLSSQSLSSSLQRSTINLIPVRIALMCSNADSLEILADGNNKAQYLQKPGEGIYNDSNGLVEGNENFQAFFLEREDVNEVLETLQTLPNDTHLQEPIIFRGDQLPKLHEQPFFSTIEGIVHQRSPRVFFGNPVSMDQNFNITLSKSSGSNILISGFNNSLANNILASIITSLILTFDSSLLELLYFNFTDEDSEEYSSLHPYLKVFLGKMDFIESLNINNTLKSVSQEIDDRIAGASRSDKRIVLIFSNIQRARKFRSPEFGEDPVEENDLLLNILTNGPDVGIHMITQVDSQLNFTRIFDNKIREFSFRIALQSTENDSTFFVKSNEAAKLTSNRSLFYNDTDGTFTKMIPFERPQLNWLGRIHQFQNTPST